MKLLFATVATLTAALAGSSMAQAATLVADPAMSCYPEGSQVLLLGEGFTPNAPVNFTRDGAALPADPPIMADPAGQLTATLTLPGLLKGQQTLDYVATDTANTANTGALSLLVTATDVALKPEHGKPQRLLTIGARGFFGGGKTLWAHVKRGRGSARNVKIGRIKGPCKKVKAKKRLFLAGAASGEYRVQFDAFKRYEKKRAFKSTFNVTIFRTFNPAAAASTAGAPSWSWSRWAGAEKSASARSAAGS
jgi:hypothetical protein